MERDGSLQGLEAFDKLSLEKARTLDVDELDEEGWRIASMEKRIVEMGNLGEGAGGAVTKAKLKGGSTVFALKVRDKRSQYPKLTANIGLDYHYQPRPRCQEADSSRIGLQQRVCLGPHLPVLWCLRGSCHCHHLYRHGVL